MTRRSVHIALHWSIFLLILIMVKGGTAAAGVRWTYSALVALWVGMALIRGPIGKPGPKLPAMARAVYGPMHWLIYATLGLSAVLNAGELLGLLAPGGAWASLLVLLSMGALHGVFQFWRHTALMDGALRLIIPKSLHYLL